jgi:phage terminase small subunit
MPRGGARPNTGGARPGAGRPPKRPRPIALAAEAPGVSESPLDFMLRVMRDPAADACLRARMAIAAAVYVHPRAVAPGKKEDAQEAAGRVGEGRLATPATPPRLIVNNNP